MKVRCPVCGKFAFEEYADFDICPVCNWENDGLQYDEHNYAGGANEIEMLLFLFRLNRIKPFLPIRL